MSGYFDESLFLAPSSSPLIIDSIERLQANEEDDAAIAAILAADNEGYDRPDFPENLRRGTDLDAAITQHVTVSARRGFLTDLLGLFTLPSPDGGGFDSDAGSSGLLRSRGEELEERLARREEKRLNARLRDFGLRRNCVAGDGNCQFRALADQIYRNKSMHRVVRGLVIKELRQRPERYQQFIHHPYDAYVAHMSVSGNWGDHVTLQAAANALNVAVHLITSASSDKEAHIVLEPAGNNPVREIWLSYIMQRHYDSIYPADSPVRSDQKCVIA